MRCHQGWNEQDNNINVQPNSMASRQPVWFENNHFQRVDSLCFLSSGRHWSFSNHFNQSIWRFSDVSSSFHLTIEDRREMTARKRDFSSSSNALSYHSKDANTNASQLQWQIRIDDFLFDHHYHHLRLHFEFSWLRCADGAKRISNTQDNWSVLRRFDDVNGLCNQGDEKEIAHTNSSDCCLMKFTSR